MKQFRMSHLLLALGVSLIIGSYLFSSSREIDRTEEVHGFLSENHRQEYVPLGTVEEGLEIYFRCSFNEVATLSLARPTLTLEHVDDLYLQWHVGCYIASNFLVRSLADYFICLSKVIEDNFSVAYSLSYVIFHYDYRDYSTLVFTTGVAITVSSLLSIDREKHQDHTVVKGKKAQSQPKTGDSRRRVQLHS